MGPAQIRAQLKRFPRVARVGARDTRVLHKAGFPRSIAELVRFRKSVATPHRRKPSALKRSALRRIRWIGNMTDLRVASQTSEGDVIALLDDLIVAHCVASAPDAAGRLMTEFLDRELATGPRWLLVSLGPSVPGASDAMRDVLAAVFQRHQSNIRGLAIVMLVSS